MTVKTTDTKKVEAGLRPVVADADAATRLLAAAAVTVQTVEPPAVVTGADVCGVTGGDGSSCADACGVPNGDGSTCADACGVPFGDESTCADACGVPFGDGSSCADACGVPNGDGSTCADEGTGSRAARACENDLYLNPDGECVMCSSITQANVEAARQEGYEAALAQYEDRLNEWESAICGAGKKFNAEKDGCVPREVLAPARPSPILGYCSPAGAPSPPPSASLIAPRALSSGVRLQLLRE